jgi:hypothetical protein
MIKRVVSHLSQSVYDQNLWRCDRKIRVQKIVHTLGAQRSHMAYWSLVCCEHQSSLQNSWHHFVTFCRFIMSLQTVTICLWISPGRSLFALRNRMMEHTSHLAGLQIGTVILNTSHSNKAVSTTAKQAQLTGKDQGRRQCCHIKLKKCSYQPTCDVSFIVILYFDWFFSLP